MGTISWLGVPGQKIDFLPFDSYATRRIPLSKLALTKRLHHRQIPYRSPDDVYQTWLLKARTARGAHRRNESRARSQHVVDATPRASCARGYGLLRDLKGVESYHARTECGPSADSLTHEDKQARHV